MRVVEEWEGDERMKGWQTGSTGRGGMEDGLGYEGWDPALSGIFPRRGNSKSMPDLTRQCTGSTRRN
jgi:hypothetical protein